MSVLLGGHFTTEQKWTFCCFDFELHYLLYARPPIFPGSRVQREVEDYVETQSSTLGWSTRYNMIEIVVDISTGNHYQVLDPKFHPQNNGVTTLVGVGGDCVNVVRNKYSECRKVWQERTNVAHPLDADGDLFASKVCDLYIDWWQHCIRGEFYALRCRECNFFQDNILRLAALQTGDTPYVCRCVGQAKQRGCWESFSLH